MMLHCMPRDLRQPVAGDVKVPRIGQNGGY